LILSPDGGVIWQMGSRGRSVCRVILDSGLSIQGL
jgi:hypothetical protein